MKTARQQLREIRTLASNPGARARAAGSLVLARRRIERLMSLVDVDAPPLQLLIEIQAIKRPLRETVTVLLTRHLHYCIIASLRGGLPAQIDATLKGLEVLYALTSKLRG